jgi:hypothetical protein
MAKIMVLNDLNSFLSLDKFYLKRYMIQYHLFYFKYFRIIIMIPIMQGPTIVSDIDFEVVLNISNIKLNSLVSSYASLIQS